VGEGADSRCPVVRETSGRQPAQEGVNRRGKRISHEDTTDARVGWARRAISACGDGAADELAGPEAKRVVGSAGPKIKKKRNFRIKIGFLNLSRLWKFVEGDLGGILT
jgi:hypothetical protein